MGEVYRAHDAKLGRDVAVKALPEGFSQDAERLARFEREAQALAALNHPNIAIIHELKEIGASKYLILELIEGDTLAGRIARGPLPLDEAFDIARQIAEALEAAHEKGIVHRDLKPANVKVTPQGRVKVLDFGLAKVYESGNSSHDLSDSPTLSALETGGGVILGTVAYMSPEQARGKTVDRRTDVWAFGCILYEMLTGRHVFPNGETVSDTIAGILAREPDWSVLPSGTPPKVRTLLERCLRKDVRRRLPDIAEARIEMEEAGTERATIVGQPATAAPRRREVFLAAVLALVLLAAAALVYRSYFAPAPQAAAVRFEVGTPATASFPNNSGFMQLSPDGRKLAFVSVGQGVGPRIYLRPLESATAQPLVGTEGLATNAAFFWAADSQSIGFITTGKLNKISVAGGPPQVICNLPRGTYLGGAWNADGVILLGRGIQAGPLLRVSAAGGEPSPATELDASRKESRHALPNFLPDGRHFTYLAEGAGANDRTVYVGALDSKDRRLLQGITTEAKYSSTGHIIFLRNNSLMAQPFDVRRLELSGDTFPIDELGMPPLAITGPYTASMSGVLAYRSGPASAQNTELAWFDRNGRRLSQVGPPGDYSRISLSPDGKSIVFERGVPSDIWVMDITRGIPSRVVSDPANDVFPVWSPDGKSIVFSSDRGGPAFYERAVGVVAEEKKLLKTDELMGATDWSRSGYIAFNSPGGPAISELFALPLSGDQKPIRLVDSPGKMAGRISPDGHWIAYMSNESPGNQPYQLYIQSFPQPRVKQQVSIDGAYMHRWSRDGKELFYLAPDLTLMAVPVKYSGESIQVGAPVPLFKAPINPLTVNNARDYDPAPDGRFLINVAPSASPGSLAAPITVIVNWAANFKK